MCRSCPGSRIDPADHVVHLSLFGKTDGYGVHNPAREKNFTD